MSRSFSAPAGDLNLALTDVLRLALEAFPDLVLDQDQLASRLAPALGARLADAAAAGTSSASLARALTSRLDATDDPAADSIEERVLTAMNRHVAGRQPGVTPDSLATLTGLPAAVLGPAVSALVQAGDLVRDGWLVRLPQPDDFLPASRPEPAAEQRHEADRRAIGDRRAVGERRLFDRRIQP